MTFKVSTKTYLRTVNTHRVHLHIVMGLNGCVESKKTIFKLALQVINDRLRSAVAVTVILRGPSVSPCLFLGQYV